MKRIKYANGVQGMVLRTQEGESNAERGRGVLGRDGCARRTAARKGFVKRGTAESRDSAYYPLVVLEIR